MALRLVASDDLALESQDDTHVVVVNRASAARIRLSLSAYRFLKAFSSPRRLDQVVSDQAAARLLPQVRMLIDKQMLVDSDAPASADAARLRAAVAYKFCGAPAFVNSTKSNFIILGIPYDLAGDIDCRLAPALIRQKSLDYSYQLEFGDGRPRGWFDVNRGVWMLRGAKLADAGDVPVEYGETRARFFERVRGALAECGADQCVPVILGGDRSVTRAALGGLQRDRKLTLVQITPDPERAAAEGAGRQVLQMDEVERVVSLGAYQDDPRGPGCDELLSFGAKTLRERGPEEIVRAWGEESSIYLSIDLGIAMQAYMKAGAEGLPPGLTLHELKALIAAIGKFHRIVGIDLVGLDMRSRSPELTAIIGCHLALAAMSAAHDRI
jgi:agmatinase